MSVEKIRGTDTADLKKQLSDSEEQMFRLRFQLSMGQQEGIKKAARTEEGTGAYLDGAP